jgi:uncharacterized protein (TIGR01244 family)
MPADMQAIKDAGFRAIICNRPDVAGADQPTFNEIATAAKKVGFEAAYLPIVSGKLTDDDARAFDKSLTELPGPVLAYCRTGTRSATLWSLAQADQRSLADILAATIAAGYDMAGVVRRIVDVGKTPTDTGDASYEVVIVGADAPQKAMYLSGNAWFRRGMLKDIDIQYNNAGCLLFGVKEYVTALMDYVKKYVPHLKFFYNLVAVDGPAKKAWFDVAKPDTPVARVEMDFDMMHVCPPQTAPDFIRVSPLANAAGWVDVDQATLRHKTYDNIWSLGDVMNAPNAKTMAAARIQAPVVVENIVADMAGESAVVQYNGYGSCPLTVARGKIVLAEFGHGGKLLPSFPKAIIDFTKPSRVAWFLKEKLLPPIYWKGMLNGREWMARPE